MSRAVLIDRYERYLRVLKNNTDNFKEESLDFKGKNVFELGCGPLLGWGPESIYKGANAYFYDEPFIRNDVIKSPLLKEKYFKQLFNELKI